MKPKFLGDAKDLAKGHVFHLLRQSGHICGPVVLPFFTCSESDLNGGVVDTYATILGVSPSAVLSSNHWKSTPEERDAELKSALSRWNLSENLSSDTIFLDPDTGVRESLYLRRRERNRSFVSFAEILQSIESDQDRIAVVYDESYSNSDKPRLHEAVRDKLEDLLTSSKDNRATGFAYVGMALNLLFVGNQHASDRIKRIADELETLLSRANRIVRPEQEIVS